MKDFFISYNKADRVIAITINAWLQDAGFSTICQAIDFTPGANFVLEMDKALKECEKTLLILSPDYLAAPFPQTEWAATFAQDPTGEKRKLFPVRVRACELQGILATVVYLDLVGLTLEQMEEKLIAELKGQPEPPIAAVKKSRKAAKKTTATKPAKSQSASMSIQGNNNIQAGRDVIMTQKHVTKSPPVVPQSQHITDSQAKQILDALNDLGKRDFEAGKGDTYASWKSRFYKCPWLKSKDAGITSYKLVPAEQFDDAISWIQQQKAMNRPALRRTQNDTWRNDHYTKIYAAAKTLQWGKSDIYSYAAEYLNLKKPITSLKDLGEQNLKALAGAMYRKSR